MKLFQNLFKPKWKNKDPEIRKTGLLELDPAADQAVFLEIVNHDDVSDLRLLAVKRINDVKALERIAENNSDTRVKEQAYKMLCQAYAGNNTELLTTDKVTDLLSQLENQKLLEYVAQNGANKNIRAIAIDKVSRDALLGNLACQEKDPSLRKVAAEKIQQKSTLERVFKRTKTKDKVISGLVKARLDEIIKAEEEPKKRL
ncbi:MAG: hypothetical protein R3240_04470, partial [Gammaproteobacteria bacterium]|nr:hypothetical protein [Gammaproteobacteria bacterium]